MTITDTHTHLYSELFNADRDLVMNAALERGITRFFIPAIDSAYTQSMLDLEQSYPKNVFLMTGLHPTSVKDNYREELDHVAEMLAARKFVAIGEIGIDLYWDKSFLQEQKIAFKQQIQWAKKYGYPIVIHCREGFDTIFEILESEKGDDLFGIFHCFTKTLEQAKKAISYNMKLGIGGVITFKNGKIDTFLDQIELKHVVLETDSPYLAPAPFRGKRNESAYLIQVLEKVAAIYKRDISEVAAITTANSRDIFGT